MTGGSAFGERLLPAEQLTAVLAAFAALAVSGGMAVGGRGDIIVLQQIRHDTLVLVRGWSCSDALFFREVAQRVLHGSDVC